LANYPTGVYSPAAKANGQTITAAMFNDPESEIIAVENGLLNGLQHGLTIATGGLTVSTGNTVLGQNLSVAGASTLATLQAGASTVGTFVAGASTLASLHVTGASTFAGTVQFTGTFLPTLPRVVLTHSTRTAVAAGGVVVPSWDTEIVATAGMHSTASNSSRITFSESTGWYRVGASIPYSGASSGVHAIRFRLNDTSGIAADQSYTAAAGLMDGTLEVLVRAQSTTDYVTCEVFMGGASSNSISNVSTHTALRFYAMFQSL